MPTREGSLAAASPPLTSMDEQRSAVVRLNQLYHKGRAVIEIKRAGDVRCTVCDNKKFARVAEAVRHCTQRSHHNQLAESLEEEAKDLRLLARRIKQKERKQVKRISGGRSSMISIGDDEIIVHIQTTIGIKEEGSAGMKRPRDDVKAGTTAVSMVWAPEVRQPKSNVHYVHARADNESLRTAEEMAHLASRGPSSFSSLPRVAAFRLIPVHTSVDPKRSQKPRSFDHASVPRQDAALLAFPGSDQLCLMQHVSSGLYVTASLAPRGLVWLHADVEVAVLVRFVPVTPVGGSSNGGVQRYVLVVRPQPRPVNGKRPPVAPAEEWIASVYAPERPRQSSDLGVCAHDRRSVVLTEYNNGSVKGPKALFHFCVPVTSVQRRLGVPPRAVEGAGTTDRSKVAAPSVKKRGAVKGEEEDSDTDTASEENNDPSTSSHSSSTVASNAGSDTIESSDLANDGNSSADEEFLASAALARDGFSLFTRRQQSGHFFQDRCVCKSRSGGSSVYTCGSLGADKFTVIGFGESDALVRYFRTSLGMKTTRWVDDETKANCMVCVVCAGVPGSPSSCRIPVVLTTRKVQPSETFLCLESSLSKLLPYSSPFTRGHRNDVASGAAFNDTQWYIDAYSPPQPHPAATVPLSSVLQNCQGGPGGANSGGGTLVDESPHALYYYGNHPSLALPHRDAILEFPFNLLAVRPCMRLRGELEVVAKYFVPKGTCFLYCGPRIRRKDESSVAAISTAMSIDRRGRRIQGGNVMRFVNHKFGFAEVGNVAFRRGAIMYRSTSSQRGLAETHINFFVATRDIPAGELLLAEGYGPEYDSFIERIAYCGGRYLSAEEWQSLSQAAGGARNPKNDGSHERSEQAVGSYAACYLADIHVGSVVGRRPPKDNVVDTSASPHSDADHPTSVTSVMTFYRVTAITDDNVLLGEELDVQFPLLFDRCSDGSGAVVPRVAVLRKTEAILFIPGWDYEDAQPPDRRGSSIVGWCAKLKMPKEALGRATYDDLLRHGSTQS